MIRQAADSYARAARLPYARIPAPHPGGQRPAPGRPAAVRAAFAGHSRALAQAALVTRLAALAEAVIELREAQQHAAQAAAARRAAEHLHAERTRLTRRTESRAARSARLAAEDFPVTPWAAMRANGAQHPPGPGREHRAAPRRPGRAAPPGEHATPATTRRGQKRRSEKRRDDVQAYTVEQVAEMLHIGRDKVYCLLRTGQLRSMKIGKLRRITDRHLAEFVASLETPPSHRDGHHNVGTAR